jgi:predicted permease
MTVRRALERLLALTRRRRLDSELESEIAAHLELAERDAIARGLSPEEARRAARLRFGGVEQIKEQHRDRRSVRWLEILARDFRYGLSSLRRNPGFAVAAIGVLALGIGANTAMFSIMDAVLLKPLPFPEPDRIVNIVEAEGSHYWGVSTLNFLDWKRLSTSFEAMSADRPGFAAVMIGGEPERWTGVLATAQYFRVFGLRALRGRTFGPGEDQPGAPRVIVLSYSAWQSRFGGAAGILNRDLIVDGEPHRVIGIMPPASFDREGTLFWKPLVFTPAQLTRESMWMRAVGRLRPGVTVEQARQEMLKLSAGLESLNPFWKKGWRAVVVPFGVNLVGDRLRQSIYVVFAAVAMVLLIACSNIGNLLLSRGAARKKEMAVRAALGASRGRLVAQMLAESLALCVLGGAAGIALAQLLVRAARPLLLRTLPATAEVALDLRVLGFAAVMVLGVSLLVGLLPSLRTSSGALSASLNQEARGSSGSRALLRRAMVAGEVAVSLVLVCGALLMFRSLLNLQNVDAGVRIDNIITTSIDLPAEAHPTAGSVIQFYRALTERIEAAPGVQQVALGSTVPLTGLTEGEVIVAPGLVDGTAVNIGAKRIDQHYFSVLDIPVLAGRGFDDRDRQGSPPVVVVNQELAARLKTKDPVGKTVGISLARYGTMTAILSQVQIIGVVRNERIDGLRQPVGPVAYLPLAQEPILDVSLIVRAHGEPAAVMPGVREAVRQVDPRLPLGPVSTMREVKERSFVDTTQSAWVIGAFAIVAALLAAFGLYGVLSQAVVQQRREIGIRMALGAAPLDILTAVLRNAAVMIALGLAAGLAGAVALTGLMKSLLFQVSALDPAVFLLACASMTLVALAAVFLPANRAARVDPVTTLRQE